MAAAFPAGLGLCTGTAVEIDDGVVIDTTDDGNTAARALYPRSYYQIDARWSYLSRSEIASLRAFLESNRLGEMLLVVDQVTYTVRKTGALRQTHQYGNGAVAASCRFRGYIA